MDDHMQHDARNSEQSARQISSRCISLPKMKSPNSKSETNHVAPSVQLHERASDIFEASKAPAAASGLEATLANVLDLLPSLVQVRHGIISLSDRSGIPDMTVGAGWSEGSDERCRKHLPRGAIDQIMTTGMALVAENIALEPAFNATDKDVLGASETMEVSFIGVPIRVDANVVGTLTIDRILDNKSGSLLEYDLRLLTIIANLVGQTVKLHRLFASDRERLMAEKIRMQKQFGELRQPGHEGKRAHLKGIIGDSPALRGLLEKVALAARSNSTVLLRGESGTGKELVAKAVHELSGRAKRPFIKLNCAALPETVLESELFGHEKGAFTSAFNSRKGRFELADKGTLFLDEIGEISASFQAKLLRVLQEQEFERVGSNQTIKVDVRVIAATNRNLEDAVARNEFRADLYYRISVVPLLVPPLRERRGDIPLLAAEFLKNFNNENGRMMVFDASATEVLMNCAFPGNVRELENCVQRTATLAAGTSIVRSDFDCSHGRCLSAMLWKHASTETSPKFEAIAPSPLNPAMKSSGAFASPAVATPPVDSEQALPAPDRIGLVSDGKLTDRERLIATMERSGWVQAKAARLLGLTPRQIGYALRKYGIEIKCL
ncbi:nif-specific transcriptional activator NifA [Mesorhizobium sp. LjNodule214]|uniref:nif-specific transcriptional activator NifA n=1 Tax=Mesorhizobium sp. LjNodule214 TaxID=3342252 RepID=UPI003ECDF740